MDACSLPGLTPLDEALKTLLSEISPTQKKQTVPLIDAVGSVLAQNIKSTVDIPPADNSAMDGYAMKSIDAKVNHELTLVGTVYAGHPFSRPISEGECVRIMTGAPLPLDVDTVIMQEEAKVTDDKVTFSVSSEKGSCVRKAGEDIGRGQVILEAGRILRASDIGLLASVGYKDVKIFRPVTVAIISTGDELIEPGATLQPGQFWESNSPTLQCALSKLPVNIINYGIVKDSIEDLTDTFTKANQEADIVISSGGVSVGEADYTKTVLSNVGTVAFWRLAIKPGKPFAFGHLSDSYFIGLPGNPVSALVTLHQLAMPMIRKLSGAKKQNPLRLKAVTTSQLKKSPGRTDFQRGVYFIDEQGNISVSSTGAQGSGILTSISAANCFIVLEQERGRVQVGETVTIEPFDSILL